MIVAASSRIRGISWVWSPAWSSADWVGRSVVIAGEPLRHRGRGDVRDAALQPDQPPRSLQRRGIESATARGGLHQTGRPRRRVRVDHSAGTSLLRGARGSGEGGALVGMGPGRPPMPGMLLGVPDRRPTALVRRGPGVAVAGCGRVDQLPICECLSVPVEVICEVTGGFVLSRADDELQARPSSNAVRSVMESLPASATTTVSARLWRAWNCWMIDTIVRVSAWFPLEAADLQQEPVPVQPKSDHDLRIGPALLRVAGFPRLALRLRGTGRRSLHPGINAEVKDFLLALENFVTPLDQQARPPPACDRSPRA